MKNIFFNALLIALFSITVVKAQIVTDTTVNINGNQLILNLINQRYQYNKSLVKHSEKLKKLPDPVAIFSNYGSLITFDGYQYVCAGKRIVEIKGILLSRTALSSLNEKLALMDNFQKSCAESVNLEYAKKNPDLQYIKSKDRQYFSMLNQLKQAFRIVAKNVGYSNASNRIENGMNQIKLPRQYLNRKAAKETSIAED